MTAEGQPSAIELFSKLLSWNALADEEEMALDICEAWLTSSHITGLILVPSKQLNKLHKASASEWNKGPEFQVQEQIPS